MSEENLVKKVERLEFYVNLLREFSLDPEAYVLWDYYMAEELDEGQARQMMQVFSQHLKVVREVNEQQEDIAPYWNALIEDLKPLFETLKWRTDRESILRVVRRASKLPHMYELKKLVHYAEGIKE
ncbi:DUF1878 domain-containing protein [Paenibacillus sp. YYML68]|uniref:DUF1878 domain-containing protein n=1 Tax=Paenibacillus sp. YYML68 TaxID=2909250 RepID=UPI0024935C8C|nr:DUF1878 domain-containing protein [Paenibacillus sp. YYML68]